MIATADHEHTVRMISLTFIGCATYIIALAILLLRKGRSK